MTDSNDKIIADLYQDSATEMPPSALDQKILDAAQTPKSKNKPHWMYPLSAAAVVVLGLTFMLRLPLQVDQQMQVESAPAFESKAAPKKSKQQTPERILRKEVEKQESGAEADELLQETETFAEPEVRERRQSNVEEESKPNQDDVTTADRIIMSDSANETANETSDEDAVGNITKTLIAPSTPQKPEPAPFLESSHEDNQMLEGDATPAVLESIMPEPVPAEEAVQPSDKEAPTARSKALDETKPLKKEDTAEPEKDVITVTGSRLKLSDETILEQTEEHILDLWRRGRFDQAREYLKDMKERHPDIDWSELDELILKAKN